MESLLQQLRGINIKSPQDSFPDIARNLMCNYTIKKGEKRFAIVEIEFYLFSKEHPDYITYPRKMDAGRWFFHQSGVDISFESDIELITKNDKIIYKVNDNSIFGGILIRGIYDIKNKTYIFGPQKCVNALWDNFDAFHPSLEQYPFVEKAESQFENNLFQCPRHINIDGNDKQLTRIKDWIKRLSIKNIEDIKIKVYQRKVFEYPYRFFNLQNKEKPWEFIAIPAKARPKEGESIKVN